MSNQNVEAFLKGLGNNYREFGLNVVGQLAALGYAGPALVELAKPHGWMIKIYHLTAALQSLSWTADDLLLMILKIQQMIPGFQNGPTDYSVTFTTLLKIELPLEIIAKALAKHGANKLIIAMWSAKEMTIRYPDDRDQRKRRKVLIDVLWGLRCSQPEISRFIHQGHF